MSKTKEAMKLALEALTATMATHGFQKYIDQTKDDAITALREALAEDSLGTEQPDRHELQKNGKHPAPCARFCEANAFYIEIRGLRNRLAEQSAQPQESVPWNKKIRDNVDSLLSQAGFDHDSSVRNQLACMNFDTPPPQHPVAKNWRHVIPGGRKTDIWDSARAGDYNKGWNDYRKAALENIYTSPPAQWEPDDLTVVYMAGLRRGKELAHPKEPDVFGVLFAVEEAIRSGDCPWKIESAFDEYEAERKAAHGIKGGA